MAKETFQLRGDAASIYEEQKVPAMFAPLAGATLDAVKLSPNDCILDVACGTGIVARKIRERIGPEARIVGADLNEGMIETARSLSDPVSESCEWYVAPVDHLPFGDGEFTRVFCQQGFQFFPDGLAALKEMKRVLKKDGEAVITVWKEPSPFFVALSQSIKRHVGSDESTQSLAPFTYDNHANFESLAEQAGFAGFARQELTVNRTIGRPETAIEKEILGNTVGPAVQAKGHEVMQCIVMEVTQALPAYLQGENLVVPQTTCLYRARVP